MRKMNPVVIMVVATILLAFVASCKGNDDEKQEDVMNMSDNTTDKTRDDNKDAMQQQTSSEIIAYMEIKNALVKDDAQAAQKAAKEMMEREQVNQAMKNHLSKIAGSADLKEQREYFSQLSNDLYGMAKSGKITDKTLYWNHCPMAMNGDGANWLSMNEKISNPYMGQKMPGCGAVKETLTN